MRVLRVREGRIRFIGIIKAIVMMIGRHLGE